jgi:DNA-binding NtrC family response regulator
MPVPADIRVLIIDDDPAGLHAMAEAIRLLSVEPIVIDEAPSATQALDRLSEERYDCVMCDVLMPGMSGMEFLTMAQRIYPKMAVILMTAGDQAVRDEALENGAFVFLSKPLNLDTVMHTIGLAAEWTRRNL